VSVWVIGAEVPAEAGGDVGAAVSAGVTVGVTVAAAGAADGLEVAELDALQAPAIETTIATTRELRIRRGTATSGRVAGGGPW